MPDARTTADIDKTTAHRRWPESKRKMSIGLMVPLGEIGAFGGEGAPGFTQILDIVHAAAEGGVEIGWFADHFSYPPNADTDRERGSWDAFTLMAALAGATRDLDIAYGPLVACATFRNPGLLARMTETLDDVSGGKFILGLGAGWHKPEYDAYGYPFDHRVSRFEEIITIVAEMLRDGKSTFSGQYVQTDGAENRPRGPRAATGGAPLMIGSSGDRMLSILARYADAWNTGWEHEVDAVRPQFTKLDAALDAAGRDRASVVRTVAGNVGLEGATGRRGPMLTGSDDEIADRLAEFRDFGVDHYIVGLDPCTPESVAHLGRIIARYDAG